MKDRSLSTIGAVVDAHLCTGCGVCAYLRPDELAMADVPRVGRRPLPIAAVTGGAGGAGGNPVTACPGRRLEHPAGALDGAPYGGEWGPVLALYECWSTDPDLRHRGSSGGVVSALSAHGVTSGSAVGVLQIQAAKDDPLQNETVLNRTYEQIVGAAGSRYSPASPCERLDLVEEAEGPCIVVGKPCDIAAVRTAGELRPALAERLALTIGIFCAGTPSTAATGQVIRSLGVDPAEVSRLDYRGEGWPGRFRVVTAGGDSASTTYEKSWGALTKHRQWRCLICPDHTGEFADLGIGDPWYRKLQEGESGRSLVIVRTERGRAALATALADGVVAGHELPLERLRESQPGLESTRGAVWGRLLTMRLLGLPAPTYRGMPAFRLWWKLSLRDKVTSTGGTWRRVRARRLRRPEVGAQEAQEAREGRR
ncbi:Coenzyme F420 hydrogenase/dehydrogenase, beta subunit C-terminal domain [Ruania suaedae]|uniref:Coenzyme F420 hydrogenase/dehydrogenase, beta subunit C-terminal domain n=1 Tax=Ruania suaedae TaxID=2897774 RepID=UPI001E34773E|nr:Coenzyme F420 hydrogenase/dehydrogenase, beta subunit C-terminal domain [Ruania suaedae]UFU02387.1 Coenzyme F420 hydrogenase/dehydrogenase, beta subunit C-terminal domain [Ruania suaedae]